MLGGVQAAVGAFEHARRIVAAGPGRDADAGAEREDLLGRDAPGPARELLDHAPRLGEADPPAGRRQQDHELLAAPARDEVAAPSDDPTAWAIAARARARTALSQGAGAGIATSTEALTTTDDALASLGDVFTRARELAIEGATDPLRWEGENLLGFALMRAREALHAGTGPASP